MEPKYKIGDLIWYASVDPITKRVECPECFGDRYLTVILGDKSVVRIECAGCQRAYDPPKGYVEYKAWEPRATQVRIERIEISGGKIEYGHSKSYQSEENELFETEELANARAAEKAREHEKEQLERIHRKEKNNRTWSWRVHYHRDCIRKAEKDLIYHKAKLEAAKAHVKEEFKAAEGSKP